MKKVNIVLIFTVWYLNALAQITITNTSFPVAGDSVIIINDFAPSVISAGNGGPNQLWNFSSINNASQMERNFLNPSATPNGSAFSNASLSVTPALTQGNGYAYLNITASEVDLTGFSGDPGIGYPLTIHFSTPGIISRAGTTYNSAINYTNSFLLTVTGIEVGQPLADSVRIHYDRYSQNFIDGWGTVITPAGTFPCLRNKITDSIVTVVDVLISFSGWQNNFQSTVEIDHLYKFIDNSFMDPVLELEMNNTNDTIVRTSYRSSYYTTAGIPEKLNQSSLSIFPNPVYEEDTHLQIEGMSAGNYYIQLTDANAKLITDLIIHVSEISRPSIDLSRLNLTAGTYTVNVYASDRHFRKTFKVEIVK